MRKLFKSGLLVVFLFVFGFPIFANDALDDLLKEQMICQNNFPKTVTVFIDEIAKEDFELKHITPQMVLEKIQETFWKGNGLEFCYALESLQIKDWSYSFAAHNLAELVSFFDTDQRALKDYLFNDAVEKSENEDFADVVMFFSGEIENGVGRAMWNGRRNREIGNGIILLGTMGTDDWGTESSGYLNFLTKTGVHEQAHLYFLKHVDDTNSIMFSYSDVTNSLRFDKKSRRKLEKALNEFE